MEIYRANDSFVDGSMKINSALKSSVVQTLLIDIGEYSNNPIAAHPIIRDWYMCSILFDTPKDVSSTSTEGAKSCSASSTIEEIKLLKGVAFVYHKGMNTIKSNDDEYVRVTGQGVI